MIALAAFLTWLSFFITDHYQGIEKGMAFSPSMGKNWKPIKDKLLPLRSLRKIVSFGNLYLEPPRFPENIFEGEVYVLVSGKTFSSGNYFATILTNQKTRLLH